MANMHWLKRMKIAKLFNSFHKEKIYKDMKERFSILQGERRVYLTTIFKWRISFF